MNEFRLMILEKIDNMKGKHLDIVSGDIHREMGGYPGPNHRMPSCCSAMRELMNKDDEVLFSPKKGFGATLKIRYYRRDTYRN